MGQDSSTLIHLFIKRVSRVDTFTRFYQNKNNNNNFSIKQIDMNYENPKNKYFYIKIRTISNCITNNNSKLKHILISHIINHNMSKKINHNN